MQCGKGATEAIAAAQHDRTACIPPTCEGANGVQALELLGQAADLAAATRGADF